VDALDRLHHVHSLMVLRRGHVIAEGWWAPYRAERSHALFSISKSFTSTAIGLLVEQGRLALDERVVDLLPDDAPAVVDDQLSRLRVRHLLSMSTGHVVDGLDTASDAGGWARHLLAVPITSEPGTRFMYETGATYLLAAIATRITGERLLDHLSPRLLAPLGIEDATWEQSPDGIDVGGFGLAMTTEGIAAFGQLLLQRGRWQDRQLVDPAWVETATARHVSNGDPAAASDWSQGYGFQFWRGRHGSFRADGAFGQLCVVLPEQEVVVAVTAGVPDMQAEMNVLWGSLLPALAADGPLSPDRRGQARLTERLSSLRLPPPTGVATSGRGAAVSGIPFRFDGTAGLTTLELRAIDDRVELALTGPGLDACVIAGHDAWLEGGRALADGVGVTTDRVPGPVAGAYAWRSMDELEVRAWAVDTAFCWTIRLTFPTDDRVEVELAQNVAFGPPPVIRATGTRDRTDLAP
jgi:CubicO group peptidase (beta-lactamase class C family)